jgi:hypothetical protein
VSNLRGNNGNGEGMLSSASASPVLSKNSFQNFKYDIQPVHQSSANNMEYYKMYTLSHVSGGSAYRISLFRFSEAASVRNACDLCHTIGYVQSGLGVPGFQLSSTAS